MATALIPKECSKDFLLGAASLLPERVHIVYTRRRCIDDGLEWLEQCSRVGLNLLTRH